LQANPDTYPPPAELSDPHSYESQKRRRFQGALQNIRHKLITRDQDILSAQNRKALGMASSGQDIIDLANAIEEVSTQGLISNENKLTLVNVFGSFDPFAHTGHLAVAEQAHNEVAQTGMDTRVVMSTFAANPKKPATEGTFPQRVDNLHRAMLEVPFVTALGIAGDFSNIEKRRAQTELLASLDKDGKFRRACGSDVLEVQLDRAKGGDDFAKSLFQSTDVLYVCPRRGYVKDVFARQLAEVRSMYPHIELVQLGEIGVARSGTHLRTLEPEQRRRYATNRHVNMAI
jgi:nicotinamide mononucleotide adenylyltransferase